MGPHFSLVLFCADARAGSIAPVACRTGQELAGKRRMLVGKQVAILPTEESKHPGEDV